MKSKKKIIFIAVSAVLLLTLVFGLIYVFAKVLPEKREQEELALLIEEYYQTKLTTYEEENARYADYEVDVAFLGDSLTDGYDLAKYYPQYLTANRGIGGETTFGLEERLKVSVYDLKPKVAVLLIGGNNLTTMFDNYENILSGLQTNLPQTKVVLVSLTAMGQSWGHRNQIAAYNNVKIKMLAEKYGFGFVDLFTPLMDLETGEIRAEYTTDGAHQTASGYEVFTREITPAIEAALGNEKNG